jgi:hypothetical protein
MKQSWQLLGEVCPAAGQGDEQATIAWVRSCLAKLGVADTFADRVAYDLAELAPSRESGLGQTTMWASCQVFVPANEDMAGDAPRTGLFSWSPGRTVGRIRTEQRVGA